MYKEMHLASVRVVRWVLHLMGTQRNGSYIPWKVYCEVSLASGGQCIKKWSFI